MSEREGFRVGFMLLGAMKAGTTTLHALLEKHPELCMSRPKEPHFFSKSPDWRAGLDQYHALFAQPGLLCGEASTTYTCQPEFNPRVWDALWEYNPQLKLLYLMRHPVDRLVSHYVHLRERGYTRLGFSEALRAEPSLLGRGRYASQLEPYLERFGPGQVLPLFFEDLSARQDQTLLQVTDFLGVAPLPPGQNLRANASGQALKHHHGLDRLRRSPALAPLKALLPPRLRRWLFRAAAGASRREVQKPQPSAQDLLLIRENLLPQVERVETLTGRDLSHWKTFTPQ